MFVKSLNACDHLEHLQETFDILRKHNVKLNPEKCEFGVSSVKFLGFLVSQKGIEREENSEVDALANLGSSMKMKGSDFGTVVQLMHSILDADSYYEENTTNLVRDWRNKIIDYLEHGKCPEDPKASRALRAKVA
nr:uncharacterized protein LOC108946507 [Nicotiana tomentosiformis]